MGRSWRRRGEGKGEEDRWRKEKERRARYDGKSSSEWTQAFACMKDRKGSLCSMLLLRQRDQTAEGVIRHLHSHIG